MSVWTDPDVDLRVDRSQPLPVGMQLEWNLRALIGGGRLAPGERLPSIRELADLAGVNVNTVRAVYGRLEAAGLVASEQGRGTFVAGRVPADERLDRIASEAKADAREADVDPREVAARLYASVDAGPPGAVPERLARRELRGQIARLEKALARHPQSVGSVRDDPGRRPPEAGLLSAAELERIRDDLLDRLEELDAARAEVLHRLEILRDVDEDQVEEPTPPRSRAPSRHTSSSLGAVRVRWVGGT